MRELRDALKRSILSENPLLVSVLGLSGAVVFTRDIVSALTASVTAFFVLAAAVAATNIFEHFAGTSGAKIVFFSTSVAMTAICGALTEALFPAVWEKIGACYPLFAVGSLSIVASRRRDGGISIREIGAFALVAGYGAALVIVAAIRQLFGALPIMATSGGALIVIGVAAAVLRAVMSRFDGDGSDTVSPEDDGADSEAEMSDDDVMDFLDAELTDDGLSVSDPDTEGMTDEHE